LKKRVNVAEMGFRWREIFHGGADKKEKQLGNLEKKREVRGADHQRGKTRTLNKGCRGYRQTEKKKGLNGCGKRENKNPATPQKKRKKNQGSPW